MSEINVVTANNFKSTKQSRAEVLAKLSDTEKSLFKAFVKSVGA